MVVYFSDHRANIISETFGIVPNTIFQAVFNPVGLYDYSPANVCRDASVFQASICPVGTFEIHRIPDGMRHVGGNASVPTVGTVG